MILLSTYSCYAISHGDQDMWLSHKLIESFGEKDIENRMGFSLSLSHEKSEFLRELCIRNICKTKFGSKRESVNDNQPNSFSLKWIFTYQVSLKDFSTTEFNFDKQSMTWNAQVMLYY